MNCPCDDILFPPALNIPAGLSHIARQIATFPEFRGALLEAIRAKPPLTAWRARESGDFGILLLEMWAYVCDVVSFYDEVIAQETYLRTARQRASLRELVALLGYVPRPAIAATVLLAAFADGRQPVLLPARTAFRSGAFNGNPPQVFEMETAATLHPFFNQWILARFRPGAFGDLASFAFGFLLNPATVALKRNDLVLYLAPGAGAVVTVVSVAPTVGKDGESYRQVTFNAGVFLPAHTPVNQTRLLKPTATAGLWKLPGGAASGGSPSLATSLSTVAVSGPVATFLGGGAAPAIEAGPGGKTRLILDSLYRQIHTGDYVILSKGGDHRWFQITQAREQQRVVQPEGTIEIKDGSGKVTSSVDTPAVTTPVTTLLLDTGINAGARKSSPAFADWGASDAADIIVHYGLIEGGLPTTEYKTTLERTDPLHVVGPIEQPRDLPAPGRFLLEDKNNVGREITGILDETSGTLTLDQTVEWPTPLDTPVRLNGNVLKASRGETVHGEVLGVGDGSVTNQSFTLKKKPLTYLPSAAAGNELGAVSTLKVYVDGILWSEVPYFFGVPSTAQVYIVRQDDTGASTITFGDGARGRRLPTGAIVFADYRFGAGAAAPPAGSVHQIARPAKGLTSIRNPVAATGGADAPTSATLRTDAPRSALLLGRAVSLQDMEAVVAGVGGVRAVRVEWRWNERKQRPLAQIYYIGETGLETQIVQTLQGLTDPTTPFAVDPAQPVRRTLALDIGWNPTYREEDVLADARAALTDPTTGLIAPENIGIGKPFYRSRLFAAVLSVPGAETVRGLLVDGAPFPDFGLRAAAGTYFDFVSDLLLNGKAGT